MSRRSLRPRTIPVVAYWLFAADGTLLYAGRSKDWERHAARLAASMPWFDQVARVQLMVWPVIGETAADQVKKLVLRTERGKYNDTRAVPLPDYLRAVA